MIIKREEIIALFAMLIKVGLHSLRGSLADRIDQDKNEQDIEKGKELCHVGNTNSHELKKFRTFNHKKEIPT